MFLVGQEIIRDWLIYWDLFLTTCKYLPWNEQCAFEIVRIPARKSSRIQLWMSRCYYLFLGCTHLWQYRQYHVLKPSIDIHIDTETRVKHQSQTLQLVISPLSWHCTLTKCTLMYKQLTSLWRETSIFKTQHVELGHVKNQPFES